MKTAVKSNPHTVLSTTIDVLNQLASESSNINDMQDCRLSDVFYTKASSKASIEFFVNRIHEHFELCDSSLIVMMIYLNKASLSLPINKDNAFKMILGAAIAAVKFCYDEIYDDKFYAKVGGVTTNVFAQIESAFLNLIDYELYISEELYNSFESVYLC